MMRNRDAGFTLLEMVVVTAMFATILLVAYQILVSTLRAADRIDMATRSGRVGNSIIALLRRDLQGTFYHYLGERVFLGNDDGDGESAKDELHFISTSDVPDPYENQEWTGEVASIGYVLQESSEGDGLTLFRRVRWEMNLEEPFEGESYFPIYNRVRSLNLRYLDETGTWSDDWNSVERFQKLLEFKGIGQEQEPPTEEEEEILEPVVVPIAVEITLAIYLGDEKGTVLDEDSNPVVEEYYAVVPISVAETLRLDEGDPLLLDPGGTGGDPGGGSGPGGNQDGEGGGGRN